MCVTVVYRSKGSEAWQALVWSPGHLVWLVPRAPVVVSTAPGTLSPFHSCCWVTWLTLFLSLTFLPSLNLCFIFSKMGILTISCAGRSLRPQCLPHPFPGAKMCLLNKKAPLRFAVSSLHRHFFSQWTEMTYTSGHTRPSVSSLQDNHS